MLKVQIKNVNSRIDGFIPIEVFNDLYDSMAYPIMGAEYCDKFMEGQWDGIKRLFNRNKKTFLTGLIGLATSILDKHNIQYQIEDLRIRPALTQRFKLKESKKPRPYQLESAQKALIYSRGIIEAATGAGRDRTVDLHLVQGAG